MLIGFGLRLNWELEIHWTWMQRSVNFPPISQTLTSPTIFPSGSYFWWRYSTGQEEILDSCRDAEAKEKKVWPMLLKIAHELFRWRLIVPMRRPMRRAISPTELPTS